MMPHCTQDKMGPLCQEAADSEGEMPADGADTTASPRDVTRGTASCIEE